MNYEQLSTFATLLGKQKYLPEPGNLCFEFSWSSGKKHLQWFAIDEQPFLGFVKELEEQREKDYQSSENRILNVKLEWNSQFPFYMYTQFELQTVVINSLSHFPWKS